MPAMKLTDRELDSVTAYLASLKYVSRVHVHRIARTAATAITTRPLVDRLHGWITTVDHKRLACCTSAMRSVLFIGGMEAAAMRIQLIGPRYNVVSPRSSTAFHDARTTMIFFS